MFHATNTEPSAKREPARLHPQRTLHALLERVSDLVTISDDDGCLLYVSPSARDLLGYTADGLLGVPLSTIVHPDDVARVSDVILGQFASDLEPSPIEYRLVHRDGSVRHVEGVAANLLDDPAVGGVVMNAHDVTERRLAVERLEQLTERFQGIVDQASDGIVTLDADQCIVMFNHAAEEIFGYAASEVLGLSLEILLPDRARGAHHGLVAGFANAPGHGRRMNTERPELTGRRADGSEFPAEITVSKLDRNGEKLLTAIVRDVTKRRTFEAELTHRASHDPLTGLAGRALFRHLGEQALARATRSGLSLAVLYVDLDGFKAVNDTLGHPAGDELLQVIAGRFERFFRTGDSVARFGGDEFAVLCEPAGSAHDMASRAATLISVLSEPVKLAGTGTTAVGASIGMAFAEADSTIETMLRDADVALYRAKHGGRGRAVVFGMGRPARTSRDVGTARPDQRPKSPLEGRRTCRSMSEPALPARERRPMTAATSPHDPTPVPATRFQTERGVRALVEHTSDLILVVDDEGAVLYANSAAKDLLGRNPATLVGTSSFDLVHGEDVGLAVEALAKSMAAGNDGSVRIQLRSKHTDGTYRHVALSAHNLLDDPDIAGIVVTARDVTAQVEAEAALLASEERFRAIAQQASDLVTICDAHGKLRYVSPSVHLLLGYEPEELIDSVATTLLHAGDQECVTAEILRQFEHGAVARTIEYRLLHRDGSVRYVEGITTNLLHEPAVRGVVTNSHDVTERHEATCRLEALTARFEGIVEQASDAIVSLDGDQRIVMFNKAAEQLFGYEAADVCGGPLDILLPERARQAHRSLVEMYAEEAGVSRDGRRTAPADGPSERRRGVPRRDHDLEDRTGRRAGAHGDRPRRHETPRVRGRARVPRRARRADGPPEPRPVPGEGRAGPGPRRAVRLPARGDLSRSRPLQVGQRHLRAPGRRRAPPDRRRPPRPRGPDRRHGRPVRWRRVRRPL